MPPSAVVRILDVMSSLCLQRDTAQLLIPCFLCRDARNRVLLDSKSAFSLVQYRRHEFHSQRSLGLDMRCPDCARHDFATTSKHARSMSYGNSPFCQTVLFESRNHVTNQQSASTSSNADLKSKATRALDQAVRVEELDERSHESSN